MKSEVGFDQTYSLLRNEAPTLYSPPWSRRQTSSARQKRVNYGSAWAGEWVGGNTHAEVESGTVRH